MILDNSNDGDIFAKLKAIAPDSAQALSDDFFYLGE